MKVITVSDAVSALEKRFPGHKAIGYWKRNRQIILNTKIVDKTEDFPQPGQYVVTSSGDVYGTNPVLSDLDETDYHKI